HELDKRITSTFNLGNALYKEEHYDEAMQKVQDIASSKEIGKNTIAKANHNLRNALFQSGKYEVIIAAYNNALKLNPKDDDTRYNLELSKQYLQQQQDQEKQQQNQDKKNQDKNKNDENGDGDKDKQDKDKQDQNKDGKDNQKQDKNDGKQDQNRD